MVGPAAEQPELDAADWLDGEHLSVWRRRYREARAAGLDQRDAACFADSTADIGMLRTLVDDGCPVDLIAAIVL